MLVTSEICLIQLQYQEVSIIFTTYCNVGTNKTVTFFDKAYHIFNSVLNFLSVFYTSNVRK